MKVLSNKEYEQLVKKGKVEENGYRKIISAIERKHDKELSDLDERFRFEREDKARKHNHELEDKAREIQYIKENIDMDIYKATKTQAEKVVKAQNEKEALAKEVEMYKTAFKNLGFDVKDMKEILNKLVDGVVAKNQIQVLPSGK